MTIGAILLAVIAMIGTIMWTTYKITVRTGAYVVGASDSVKEDLDMADKSIRAILKKVQE